MDTDLYICTNGNNFFGFCAVKNAYQSPSLMQLIILRIYICIMYKLYYRK